MRRTLLLVVVAVTIPVTPAAAGGLPTDTLPDGEVGMFLPDSIYGFQRIDAVTTGEPSDTLGSAAWENGRVHLTVRVHRSLHGEPARYRIQDAQISQVAGHPVQRRVTDSIPSTTLEFAEGSLRIRVTAEPSSGVSGLIPLEVETAVDRAFASIVGGLEHRAHPVQPAPRSIRVVRLTGDLREGPGTDYPVVGEVVKGDSIWVSRDDRIGWRAVFEGKTTLDTVGWIRGDLVGAAGEFGVADRTEPARRQPSEGAYRRRQFADQVEKRFLERGLDVYVSVRGREDRTLRMEWILAGRPEAYQLKNNRQLMNNLADLGFEKFELTDGYSERWSWKIR